VGVVALLVAATWTANDGGYAEVLWYPGALLLVVLLAVLEWSVPGVALGRRALAALAALALFTGWSFLSIAWADDRGLALTGAGRTLAYLVAFAVALRRPWTRRNAFAWGVLWALAVVGIGLVVFLKGTFAADPTASFAGGRLTAPIDYANANAALFVLPIWPLVVLAQDAEARAELRALAFGAAAAAVDLALLAQSKGAALASFATLLVFVAVGGRRVRRLVPIVVLGALAAAFSRPLFDVYTRVNDHDAPVRAIRDARSALLWMVAIALVAGWAIAVVDRRFFRGATRLTTGLTRAAGGLLWAGAVAAVIALLVAFGNPVTLVRHGWRSFTNPPTASTASSHFASAAGNHRYDFWRVAGRQFTKDPLTGAGVENFAADYVQHRRTDEEPLYPHSIEARVLGGTGLVGFVLLGSFLVAVGAACWRLVRGRAGWRPAAGLVPPIMLVYWLAHGSVDWLWEFPALSMPVFFLLGAAAVAAQAPRATLDPRRRLALSLAVAGAAVSLVLLVPPWLAARDTQSAADGWRADASAAYVQVDRAGRLNPLTDQPFVVGGTIAERRRDWPRARRYFERAVGRVSRNWYSQLELAIADSMLGRRQAAVAAARRATVLNPRDEVARSVRQQLEAGRRVRVADVDRALLARARVVVRGA
jgi:hypothetical protein